MTVLDEAKAAGLTVTMVELITERHRKLLGRLYKAHPKLFRVLIAGCKAVMNKEKGESVFINGVEYVPKNEG